MPSKSNVWNNHAHYILVAHGTKYVFRIFLIAILISDIFIILYSNLNKKPIAHIANLRNDSHEKISFKETYTKYLNNVKTDPL